MCGVRRVPGAGTSRSDSKSPVLSVTNLCADRPRNPVLAVLPHPTQLPSPARPQYPQPFAHCSRPTTVARVPGLCAGFGIDPDVVQDLLDLLALSDKGDQARLPTKNWAQQGEDLVDASDQHPPQVICR